MQALAIDDEDATSSIETAFRVASGFGLTASEARRIAREVGGVVRRWRSFGRQFGLQPRALDRMESAFEHEDRVLTST